MGFFHHAITKEMTPSSEWYLHFKKSSLPSEIEWSRNIFHTWEILCHLHHPLLQPPHPTALDHPKEGFVPHPKVAQINTTPQMMIYPGWEAHALLLKSLLSFQHSGWVQTQEWQNCKDFLHFLSPIFSQNPFWYFSIKINDLRSQEPCCLKSISTLSGCPGSSSTQSSDPLGRGIGAHPSPLQACHEGTKILLATTAHFTPRRESQCELLSDFFFSQYVGM